MEAMGYRQILPYLPAGLRETLAALPEAEMEQLEELRLKPGQPLLFRFHSHEALLAAAGGFCQEPEAARRLSGEEMRNQLRYI